MYKSKEPPRSLHLKLMDIFLGWLGMILLVIFVIPLFIWTVFEGIYQWSSFHFAGFYRDYSTRRNQFTQSLRKRIKAILGRDKEQ